MKNFSRDFQSGIHRYLKYYALKLYFSVITYPLADERLLPAMVTEGRDVNRL